MSAIAIGVVGCGGGSDKPSGTNIAVVTPGARDDVDWSRQFTDAAQQAAKKHHIRAVVLEGAAEKPVAPQLTKLAPKAQLLVAPFAGDRAAAAQVAKRTRVPTLVFGDPTALKPGLVGDIEADFAAGAFQTGALAVHAARERSVGIVMCDDGGGGWAMPERFKIAAAYVAGARAASPKAKAAFVIAGGDANGAKEATLQLGHRKIQMIMDICGPAVAGVMQGIEQLVKDPVTGEDQLVGLIGDKATINKENVLLTSVVINPAVALEEALRDIRKGTFGKRVYTLTPANGGIILAQSGRTPGDAVEFAKKLPLPTTMPTAKDEVTLQKLIDG